MKKLFATLLGATAVSMLAACAGGGSDAAVDESPEGQAVTFRQANMEAIAYKVGRLRGMAMGEIPVDEAAFAKGASDVTTLAGMIVEGFIPNSTKPNSAALPEIWMNMPDFQQKAADLQNAAQALAMAAQQQGFESAKGMVQAVGQTCGGCHRPYRRRQEE